MNRDLPEISVVFITYNRMRTLRATLESFLANTDYPRQLLQLVVTDDGSPEEVQREIRTMPFDVFAFGQRRSGLGANTNRGLAAANGSYVLQLQDDWECLGPPHYLRRAVTVMEASPEIGMLILRPHPANLGIVRHMKANCDVRIYSNHPWRQIAMVGQHAYTDWPHLKRRAFIEAIGLYNETPRMWETELDYSRRVNGQMRFFVADVPTMDAFSHIGQELSFNTGSWRVRYAKRLERIGAGRGALETWRLLKRYLRPRETSQPKTLPK
jgi:Glycosyl transferase family 2